MIQGKRIGLRPVEEYDLTEEYLSWMNDPEVTRYLEIIPPYTREDLNRYYEVHNHRSYEPWFAIILHGSLHVGNIKLGPIHPVHRRADVSLFIGRKEFWGMGYGSEAISLISNYAFISLNLRKLTAGVYASNQSSRKAFEKSGFSVEATLKNHVWSCGVYADLLLMGLEAI